MKREREVDSKTMANYLMLLSRGGATSSSTYLSSCNYSNNRVFECKTCNRQFPSFQALGGHRASHKKPRFMGGSEGENSDGQLLHGSVLSKPKTHECSICGLEFAIGQALGGHMRRHRTAAAAASNGNMQTCLTYMTTTTSGSSVDNTSSANRKNKGNSRRVLFPDLNLTPLENDLEFLKIGQPTPLVYCFN